MERDSRKSSKSPNTTSPRIDTQWKKIMIASSHFPNVSRAKELLSKGANIDAIEGGITALTRAVLMGDNELFEFLLKNGANPNIGTDNTPLIVAAQMGYINIAKLLIKYGADPNFQREMGYTALIGAAESTDCDMIALLLENGADPNIQDEDGITALYEISYENDDIDRIKCIELLLKYGADPNIQCFMNKRTPFMLAVKNNDFDIVKILLENGADPNIQDGTGKTPLIYAILKNNRDMVKLLLPISNNKTINNAKQFVLDNKLKNFYDLFNIEKVSKDWHKVCVNDIDIITRESVEEIEDPVIMYFLDIKFNNKIYVHCIDRDSFRQMMENVTQMKMYLPDPDSAEDRYFTRRERIVEPNSGYGSRPVPTSKYTFRNFQQDVSSLILDKAIQRIVTSDEVEFFLKRVSDEPIKYGNVGGVFAQISGKHGQEPAEHVYDAYSKDQLKAAMKGANQGYLRWLKDLKEEIREITGESESPVKSKSPSNSGSSYSDWDSYTPPSPQVAHLTTNYM